MPTGARRITSPSDRSICYDNPLLREPLTPQHIKPRLLGHWGTTPGQNFIYVHLNRIITQYDLDMIYVCGPGHGGPAVVANTYLEGTYSEFYPDISQDEQGLQRLFRQFSFPGGIPSHAAPETPGSIHEGGELGYSLSHAYGAAFDNPALLVACVIGDGEAETGPLATGWHGNKFLNPASDGAVLPILHLNGYKIANPTLFARIEREELQQLLRGYGYQPYFVAGDEPAAMHQLMATTLDRVVADIRPDPARGAHARLCGAAALADGGAVHAEGLDRAEGRGRPQDRGHLPRPPGAAVRGAQQSGASAAARTMAAQLPSGGAVRCRRPAACRARRARAARRPAHGRQPAGERRTAAARPAHAATFASTPSRSPPRARSTPRIPACSASSCAT